MPVNLPNDRKMSFVKQIEPVDEQANHIVRTELRASCVGHEIANVSTFFLCVRAVPRTEGSTNQCQIVVALNPVIDLWTETLKAPDNVLERLHEFGDLSCVLLQPLCLQV